MLPCPKSETSLALKSLVHLQALGALLCTGAQQKLRAVVFQEDKNPPGFDIRAVPALVRAQLRALCVEAGAVHWQPWMETAQGSCWSQHSAASGRILILEPVWQSAGEPLNSWRLSQSSYFTSDYVVCYYRIK